MALAFPQRVAAQNNDPDDVRLRKFWTGYYEAIREFYGRIDQLDWVAYYKAHGQRRPAEKEGDKSAGYIPVFVEPVFKFATIRLPDGMKGPGDEEKKWEFKAVAFGTDAAEATKSLNQLAKDGWQYVGPLSNGLVAFRRPAPQADKTRP
jgi:hypothetical protein